MLVDVRYFLDELKDKFEKSFISYQTITLAESSVTSAVTLQAVSPVQHHFTVASGIPVNDLNSAGQKHKANFPGDWRKK
ncbi:MAG: hypothetical protein MH321_08880 [Leptospiraceae bacterium]|nr:hypothetical protein [Leptospiraceae bacterium]